MQQTDGAWRGKFSWLCHLPFFEHVSVV